MEGMYFRTPPLTRQGYACKDNTWETEANISENCQEQITEFLEKLDKKGVKKGENKPAASRSRAKPRVIDLVSSSGELENIVEGREEATSLQKKEVPALPSKKRAKFDIEEDEEGEIADEIRPLNARPKKRGKYNKNLLPYHACRNAFEIVLVICPTIKEVKQECRR
jgi:hypothetical protein